MGMFDDIRFAYPMPPGYEQYQNCLFQTKDLDCYLLEYNVDVNGHLFERHWELEPIPEEERESGFLGRFRTTRRTGAYTDKQIMYHGDIQVYATVGGKFADFIVRFTNGTLQYMLPYNHKSDSLATRYEVMFDEKIEAKKDPPETE